MNTTDPTQINQQIQPVIPAFLSKPFRVLPEIIPTVAITRALNIMLVQALQDGELDFLVNKNISVEVSDLKLKFALTLRHERLTPRMWRTKDDLNLSGTLYDFMLLASRQEDADTLFFHRRLKMEGCTDLGLEVKNLLDGMDTAGVRFHKQLDFVLRHGIKVFEKLFI